MAGPDRCRRRPINDDRGLPLALRLGPAHPSILRRGLACRLALRDQPCVVRPPLRPPTAASATPCQVKATKATRAPVMKRSSMQAKARDRRRDSYRRQQHRKGGARTAGPAAQSQRQGHGGGAHGVPRQVPVCWLLRGAARSKAVEGGIDGGALGMCKLINYRGLGLVTALSLARPATAHNGRPAVLGYDSMCSVSKGTWG